MNQITAEEIAKKAAMEAVKIYQKEERRRQRVKVFQNTKKLMENYIRMCKSVDEGVAELSDLESDDADWGDEDIFIASILRSKLRSLVMLAHIDKCLKLLENEEYKKNTPEKYFAFTYYYLDEMTYESITEVYGYSERTARRWVTELTSILGVYLFGADAMMLD